MSKKNISKAKKKQYQQWLAANPKIARIPGQSLTKGKTLKRNAPCYCGSGKKYKHCHLVSDNQNEN